MRVLIVEDEPLIAMDLEDIVCGAVGADCVWSRTADEGVRRVREGVDFALLDFDLERGTSLEVASLLADSHIPFCFVSGRSRALPARFRDVPRVSKPFRPSDIQRMLAR